MGYRLNVKYYNSFWLKKTIYVGSLPNPTANQPDPIIILFG